MKAGQLAKTPKVYMSTVNKDEARKLFEQAAISELPIPGDIKPEEFDLGVPGARITTAVDVSDWLDAKRAAMAAHASQIAETSFFLAMPPDLFRMAWGLEWFILDGAPPGTAEQDVFEGLDGS
jgi:LmbE family N-acetylglucosaminyl deacetylase